MRLLDGAGAELKAGRTDDHGVYRGSLPEGAAAVEAAWKARTLRLPLPAAPDPLPPALPFLLDRSVVRPGNRVRLLLLAGDGPPPPPRLVLLDPAGEEVEAVALRPAEDPFVEEPWALFEGRVPEDAPTGSARWTAGDLLLGTVPVVERFPDLPLPAGGPPGAAEAPPPPRVHGDLSRRDGLWRLAAPGAEIGARALFVALSGDRILGHAAAPVERGEAAAALPAATDGAPVRVRALAMTPRGFVEAEAEAAPPEEGPRIAAAAAPSGYDLRVTLLPSAEAPAGVAGPSAAMAAVVEDPGLPAGAPLLRARASVDHLSLPHGWHPALNEDLLLRALAVGGGLPRPLRARVAFAGRSGPEYELPSTSGEPRREGTLRLLLPGAPEEPWPGRGRGALRGSEVRWSLEAPEAAEGPFRLRCGGAIVLEGRARPAAGEEADDGRGGVLPAERISGGDLLLESRIPGLRGLRLEGEAGAASTGLPADGRGLSLEMEVPGSAPLMGTVVISLRLRSPGGTGPLAVTLPLPEGTTPGEEGWEIRRRGPEGCRVSFPVRGGGGDGGDGGEWPEAVRWTLPALPAGETRLDLRIRVHRPPGDYAAPAATAESLDPAGPWARSAAGRLVVE